MNSRFLVVILGAAALGVGIAHADPSTGGFAGPSAVQLATVAQVKEMADDTHVKVQGYIVKALGDESYEFRDDSGTLVVEIDDDEWQGIQVEPSDRVELLGEVDKDWNRVELDVDRIQLMP